MTPEQQVEYAEKILNYGNSIVSFCGFFLAGLAILLTGISIFFQWKGKKNRDKEIQDAVNKFGVELSTNQKVRDSFIEHVLKDSDIKDYLTSIIDATVASTVETIVSEEYITDLRENVLNNVVNHAKNEPKPNQYNDDDEIPF